MKYNLRASSTITVLAIVLAGMIVIASILFHALSAATTAQQHDITIAPCSMTHVPAYTRTDVCVANDGMIVKR